MFLEASDGSIRCYRINNLRTEMGKGFRRPPETLPRVQIQIAIAFY